MWKIRAKATPKQTDRTLMIGILSPDVSTCIILVFQCE